MNHLENVDFNDNLIRNLFILTKCILVQTFERKKVKYYHIVIILSHNNYCKD